MKLWTSVCDYGATCEGSTYMVLICYAEDAADAKKQFTKRFGEFFAQGCETKQGVDISDKFLRKLFNLQTLKYIIAHEGNANLELFASFHYNFS